MKGSVIFMRDEGFLSRLIRWFTRSPVSHTAIVVNRTGKLVILDIDSSPFRLDNKIRLRSLDSKLKKKKQPHAELYVPHASKENVQEAIDSILDYADTPYGIGKLLGLAIVMILRRFGIFISNPLTRGIICSTVDRQYLLHLGFSEFDAWEATDVTPADLYEQIRRSPRFTRVIYESD